MKRAAGSVMDHLFANVAWKCTSCGGPPGCGCGCWVECECGRKRRRDEECGNQIWHISKRFAEEAADLIVADMAQSYRLFQREHMAARLKRAVIRQAQPIILATFEGVESASAEQGAKPASDSARETPTSDLAGA
jgi:hypothetical protein